MCNKIIVVLLVTFINKQQNYYIRTKQVLQYTKGLDIYSLIGQGSRAS